MIGAIIGDIVGSRFEFKEHYGKDFALFADGCRFTDVNLENIYRILEHFSEFYDIMNDEERKELFAELIQEIQIYPEGESDCPLKSIKFNFPVFQNGKETEEVFLNKPLNVETLVVLSHKKTDSHLEVKIDFDNTSLDKMAISERAEKRKPQEKTTYKNM